jgi:dihydroflavonol-4-reductase
MRIAVTGATGHVGANLCRLLIARGYQVKVLIHNDDKGVTGLPLEMVKGNVLNEQDLISLCHGCDVVIHLAASVTIHKHDPSAKKLNMESCKNLLHAARISGVRKIIHFSSIHAFRQEPLDCALNESGNLAIASSYSYDYSKAWSQKMMLEASSDKMEVVVLNPTAIVGPNDYKPSLMGNAIIRFYKGQNPGLIPGGYNWVDVRDVCHAAVSAIKKGEGGECYLLPGNWYSLKELAEEITKQGGHQPPRLLLPVWLALAGAPFLNLHARFTHKTPLYSSVSVQTLKNSHKNISGEKARSVLGFNPRPFAETIADTILWFKENNYI